MDSTSPILEDQAAWVAHDRNDWLKHHQDTGEFNWKLYNKPVNTHAISGGAVMLNQSHVVLISAAGHIATGNCSRPGCQRCQTSRWRSKTSSPLAIG